MTEEFNKDLLLVAFHAPAYLFDDIRMTSTGHGKSYIKMYLMIMPPSDVEKSGKASVDRNLSPQKYVKPLVTEFWNSICRLMHSRRCAPSEDITFKDSNKIIKDRNQIE